MHFLCISIHFDLRNSILFRIFALAIENHSICMTLTPFARPFYMMAKPIGAACNLACRYCYYLDKQQLYAGVKQTGADEHRRVMSDEVLELSCVST